MNRAAESESESAILTGVGVGVGKFSSTPARSRSRFEHVGNVLFRVVLDSDFSGRLDSDSCDNPGDSTLTRLNTLLFFIDSTPTQLKSQIC